MLVKEDDDFGAKFSLFRDDDELFQIDIGGNAFNFEVTGNELPISILRFNELIDQTGKTSYSMWAERITEGKEYIEITYDMESGLPSQIGKASDSSMQIYDGEGTLLHDYSEPVETLKD